MKIARTRIVVLLLAAAVILVLAPISKVSYSKDEEKKAEVKCHLKFTLKGWSVFYERAKGEGDITCGNGQSAPVTISAHGGGITFGKKKITNGHGTFSDVGDISELFGSYATSSAHAGVVGSAEAQAMTKGDVSLALHGTGKGFDIGINFGSFEITRKK